MVGTDVLPHSASVDRLRVWCAALAVAAGLFAAYVSLVPFQFVVPDEIPSLVDLLWTKGHVGGVLRGNGLANVVLFVPFGFFGFGALANERPRVWQGALAVSAVAAASVATSVSVEILQVFVPGRTPALSDIVAQTIGTGAGVVAWMALGREARTWARRFTEGQTSVVHLALGIYSVTYVLYLLLPLDVTVDLGMLARRYRTGRIVLNPLMSPALSWELLPSLIADLVMAIPVGAFASVAWVAPGSRRATLPAFALAAVVFAGGELAQVFVQSRTADVVDLTAALAGAATGVALASHVTRLQTAGRGSRAEGQQVLLVSLAAVTVLYVAYNLSPFDFNLSRGFIASRVGRLLAIPFGNYYENPEFKALSDATIKLSLSVPFGVLLQLLLRPALHAYRRTVTLVTFGSVAVFFAAVEFGQVLLPSRYPDNTDVLLAMIGVWGGMRFTRQFQSRGRPVEHQT